ncbi:hypothetical protein OKA04_06905 [Luteolibacter flavescens]|uniref:ABC transporter permease n=1 Tax=Luteolibacter flavescens TaxID=1859460 RepID=A0ABT3FLK7_9BACT|nr:hypothetical protein [Luteolibacter flavescens]MCW1884454.1 hypothetical protein [Luteolibacter flavescens]
MRLYRLTTATLFQWKSWVISLVVVGIFPFILPQVSYATENPALYKPAIAQTTWAMALLSAIFWGFFTAAKLGENNAKSGVGEYFLTTGISSTRQLVEMWLSLVTFLAPLPLISAAICIFAASPSQADERGMWIATNLQYSLLFFLAIAPLAALAMSVASRFGAISGFVTSAGMAIYGLYGVGYLKLLANLEGNALLKWIWAASPHYHFADPTERLRYKLGAVAWDKFPLLIAYFGGILLVHIALSRLIFRVRTTA